MINKTTNNNSNNKNRKKMTTKRIKVISKIKGTSFRNTSYFGNPSYYITFENEEGETIKGYTAANASCGYSCTNSDLREFAYIEYHITKGGKVIIDDVLGKSTYERINK